jgi:hypothetical protein
VKNQEEYGQVLWFFKKILFSKLFTYTIFNFFHSMYYLSVFGGDFMPGHHTGERRTSTSRARLDNFRRGDRIQVFSAGRQLDGNGTFIRVEDGFLVWEDNSGNRNTTSLEGISIRRLSSRY